MTIMTQVGKGHRIEDPRQTIMHPSPELLRGTNALPAAIERASTIRSTLGRGKGTVQHTQHPAHSYRGRITLQLIASLRSSGAFHQTSFAQDSHELLQIPQGYFLRFGYLVERNGFPRVILRQGNHRPEPIARLPRKLHG
jgi:hypothetical protein